MVLHLGIIDYAVIGIVLAVSASVGIFFRFTGGKQKTTEEFLLASRSMSIGPVAFSLMATCMSTTAMIGVPSEIYLYGTQMSFWLIGVVIGGLVAAYAYVPVYFEAQVSTSYEYLELRFGKTTRTIASALFTIQMILYMTIVLYAPALAMNVVTGLSTWTSVISLAVVCTFYCCLGGMKAVVWTDLFQSFLMYFAVIAVVIKGSMDIGGLSESFDIASEGGRLIWFNLSVDVTERYTLWNALAWGLTYGVSTFGTSQTQIQRLLSVRSIIQAQRSLLIGLLLVCLFNIFCYWDGIVIYSYFHDCDPLLRHDITKLTSQDQLLPYAMIILFQSIPGLAGLCVSGVFSASLSSISSAVNSLTAVTMEDFIRPYCFCTRLTESWAAFLAKVIVVVYGSLCLLLTFILADLKGILEASNSITGMVVGPLLGIFTLGMLTTTANEEGAFVKLSLVKTWSAVDGALIGLLAGFAFSSWMGYGSFITKANVAHLVQSIEGCPLNQSTTDVSFTTNFSSHHNLSHIVSIENETSQEEKEKYIFPLYKVAFNWFAFSGCLIVLIVGYIASYFIGCWKNIHVVQKPEVISPVIRKWFFKQPTTGDDLKGQTQVVDVNDEKKTKHSVEESFSREKIITSLCNVRGDYNEAFEFK